MSQDKDIKTSVLLKEFLQMTNADKSFGQVLIMFHQNEYLCQGGDKKQITSLATRNHTKQ